MLILTRKQGEAFVIGDDITISISEISGERVRVAIDAPKNVTILRKELADAVELNKEAASPAGDAVPDLSSFARKIKKEK